MIVAIREAHFLAAEEDARRELIAKVVAARFGGFSGS
jgi:hypothetical protein